MKSSIALVSDLVFSSITSFLIFSVLFGYFILYPFSIILSIMGTTLFILFCSKLALSKYKKSITMLREEKEKQTALNTLNLMPKDELISLFTKAIKEKDFEVKEKNGTIFLPEKNAYVFLFFEFMQVKKADVLRAYNVDRDKNIAILSGEFSDEIKSFVAQFKDKIVLCDKDKIFALLKETNCLPEPTELNEQPLKKPFRESFLEWTKKINSKRFFIFGLTFLFFSYFAPIKGYYLVCGSIFLAISLLSKLSSLSQKD